MVSVNNHPNSYYTYWEEGKELSGYQRILTYIAGTKDKIEKDVSRSGIRLC